MQFLGIGVRSLERYMAQGRIAYTRQRGKTGEVVVFEDSELQRFKDELYQPTHEGAVEGVTVQKKIICTRLAET